MSLQPAALWYRSPLINGAGLVLVLAVLLPGTGRACSMMYVPPLSLPEDRVAIVGTVIDVVSVEASGRWSSERQDGIVFGLLVAVDQAAWNPLGRATFEVYPFPYDARCRYWSSTPEDLERYPVGTNVWLIGSVFEEAPGDGPPGARLRVKGAQNWGRYDETLAGWTRKPFDRERYDGESAFWHAGGFAAYAHYHALSEIVSSTTVEEQLPYFRGLQHLVRHDELYAELLERHLLDDRWQEPLLDEKRQLDDQRDPRSP